MNNVNNIISKSFATRRSFFRYKSTVYALSSGLGKCGVAVIRVTGPRAESAIRKMTRHQSSDLPKPWTVMLKNIRHPISQEIIDKGFVLWFPGPRSFTGEDCCEFHIHGGTAVVNGVLEALSCMETFKLAEPGEFTRRAFLNGKLNLTEVEGLADLLQAETEAQRKQAFLQCSGALSNLYHRWKQILTHSLAHLEAYINFEETETLEIGLTELVVKDVKVLLKEIETHLKDGHKGELIRHGVKTVIIGEPNVGKSSLMNLLCRRPASIVTPISGTTRDVIEVTLNISGYPLLLADTAGLRNSSQDIVELEGMSRTLDMYQKANLVVLVLDFSRYFTWCQLHEDSCLKDYIISYTESLGVSDLVKNDPKSRVIQFNKECIVVMNKMDLDNENICSANFNENVVKLSCKSENGISQLVDVLTQHLKFLCGDPTKEHPSMNQQRHREQVRKCQQNLKLFMNEVTKNEGSDVVIMAEYLKNAIGNLGKLIGTVTSEEILDVIFSEFCIGK
ncbi:tRNA modification GTPase GTPBP3, mitochondrial isoform X2 [Euwallacea fornicatus]|uniref:tRNA modification GTPase GTPBP3, mitochondrial isoform X2 n=1 Tax=Euwallacea fornicatus TaxID=995702 RepID=UPI00338ECE73